MWFNLSSAWKELWCLIRFNINKQLNDIIHLLKTIHEMVIYWPSWHMGSNFCANLFVVINHQIFYKSCESQRTLFPEENFKPEHTLFFCELRFVAIYALFWRSLGIKNAFLGKNSASWARSALLHGIYCIFYWVKFENLRLRAKTTHLSRKL